VRFQWPWQTPSFQHRRQRSPFLAHRWIRTLGKSRRAPSACSGTTPRCWKLKLVPQCAPVAGSGKRLGRAYQARGHAYLGVVRQASCGLRRRDDTYGELEKAVLTKGTCSGGQTHGANGEAIACRRARRVRRGELELEIQMAENLVLRAEVHARALRAS